MKGNRLRLFLLLLTLVEGLAALIFFFYLPSENDRSGWLGYSTARWAVGITVFFIWLSFLLLTAALLRAPVSFKKNLSGIESWLDSGVHLGVLRVCLLAGMLACLETFLLTFLSFPFHLRPVILWFFLIQLQCLLASFFLFPRPLPRLAFWSAWDKKQQAVFGVLLLLSLLFFIIIIPQNLRGAETPHIFNVAVNDENVTYVPLMWMFDTSGKVEEWVYRLIVYEDYHYGYPFYVWSALVLLPLFWFFGPQFAGQTQLNLLVLRQMVSSLPILVSTLLLVWMATRFRSWPRSLLLFLLILFIPNAASYHIRFWHPDGLVVLAVVLTLFFLQRDRARLGWNFYAAAAACGLASAVKLYGFFFVLTIPAYLLVSRFGLKETWGKIFRAATGFIVVMLLAILLASPFLGVPSARARMLQIQTEKSATISQGYTQTQPQDIYHVGLEAWLPFLEDGFGPLPFQVFLLLSVTAGLCLGKEKILNLATLTWFIGLGFYLVQFSAVKSQHYWLPAMLPLYAAALNLAGLPALQDHPVGSSLKIGRFLQWFTVTVCLVVLVMNVYDAREVFTNLFQ